MSEQGAGSGGITTAGKWDSVNSGVWSGVFLALLLLVISVGTPILLNSPGTGSNSTGAINRAQAVPNELIIRYSRLSQEEAVGVGINKDYAEVAALAFQGLSIPPEQVVIEPLFKEVVQEMRAQGLSETLALLSLIKKYDGSSQRLITSSFFEKLQGRNSPYGFARTFVVRFTTPQDVPAIVQKINRARVFFRSKNFHVQASEVLLSPVVGMRVDSLGGALPTPLAACDVAGTTVAVIGDQFITRTDLPRLQSVALVAAGASGCDATPYQPESESYGTNVAGVISRICPSCQVLGFDAGCGVKGKAVVRSTEGAQAMLSALLRGVPVVMFSTADTQVDPIYENLFHAATSAGVVVVAPAGDDASSSFSYPAASKGIIGVGATNQDGTLASFSNYGRWVVASATGALVTTAHKNDGTAVLSSTALAAATVTGFAARHLIRNPQATLLSMAVLASSGGLSEPTPNECSSGSGEGEATGGTAGGGSSTGEGSNGSDGGSGTGGGGSNSSGGNSSGSSSNGSGNNNTNPAIATPTNTPVTNTGDSADTTQPLAILKLPDALKNNEAGLSPFTIQKIRSAVMTGDVKVGVANQATPQKREIFVVSSKDTVADLVYVKGTKAEESLTRYKKVEKAIQLDKESKEYMQTVVIPAGVDIQKTWSNVPGVVGVYLHDEASSTQIVQASSVANSSARITASSTQGQVVSQSQGDFSTSNAGVSVASTPTDNAAALSEMGWDEEVQEFTEKFTEKVKVAVISTGLDYERPEFKDAVASNLLATARYRSGSAGWITTDFPKDTDGFGTLVTSLLGHERLGIARKYIELIPIKVGNTRAEVEQNVLFARNITSGIALAVNKGAEVIVLPHTQTFLGCLPTVGHAMYKAREKGVTFVISAGDGRGNAAGENIGYPVVAARDDGPASYETTATAACWSRYFLGAVSFASSEGFGKPLVTSSNFGDDIELSAIGAGIDAVGLENRFVKTQGAAFSAAWGAAAAAMAIAHHKTNKLSYGAWYIENLLVASAKRDPNALSMERRARFGSLLNFTNLKNLLVKTESMTDEQRRNDIETINPRQGDGWKPGEDKANLRYISLTLDKAIARPGEEIPYKVIAIFRNSEAKDVTSDAANVSISIQGIRGKRYIELVRPGLLRVLGTEAFDGLPKGSTVGFKIAATFTHEQALATEQARASVVLTDSAPELLSLEIIPPKSPARVGRPINLFEARATYRGSPPVATIATGAAKWSTSDPLELRTTRSPGVIDASNAVVGKSYTVYATLEGKTAQVTVSVAPENLRLFYIHNYLGFGKVERGQKVTLESRMILESPELGREQAMEAVWYRGTNVMNSGKPSRSIVIDTSSLAPGTYSFRAVSVFKSQAGNREVSDSLTITVVDEIARLEIHLKTPIVQIGQPFFADVRAYRHNNSYVVVTENVTWSTSAPRFASINRFGVGFVSDDFTNNAITVRAEYKGQTAEMTIYAIRGSVVTGSDSLIDYTTLQVDISASRWRYCELPYVRVEAKYKDGRVRNLTVASISFAELGADGKWRVPELPLYGGRTYRATVTYNDGSTASGGGGNAVASSTFVMPKERLDGLVFTQNFSGGPLPPDKPALIVRDVGGVNTSKTFRTEGVCRVTAASASPAGITAKPSSWTIGVDVTTESLGQYTISGQGFYTGMGARELKSGSFQVEIQDTKPDRLELREESTPENASQFSVYGSRPLEVTLVDSRGRFFPVNPKDDLEIKVTQGGRPIDFRSDSRIRIEIGERERSGRFLLHAYPRSLGESYTVSVLHKPTGFSASRTFTDLGSWESKDSIPWNLPSESQPGRNEKLHPACEQYLKAPSGLEYAGGTGTEKDPLIVCDTRQLSSLRRSALQSEYCKQRDMKCQRAQFSFAVALGANIDFKFEKMQAIEADYSVRVLDGDMHSISNYVIVDSEKNGQALFSRLSSIKNLIIKNPVVRGGSNVAALVADRVGDTVLENVCMIGGSVWGSRYVGGLVVRGFKLRNVRVFGTEIRYEQGEIGGIAAELAGRLNHSDQLLFAGRIAPAGVPGATQRVGGVAAVLYGGLSNTLVTGDVISLNSSTSQTLVGGIVGVNGGMIVNTVMRGNVVSTGSSVGGIAGANSGESPRFREWSSFGLDRDAPEPVNGLNFHRTSAIVRAKVEGSIWGGMSRKRLLCIDKVAEIVGVGGSTDCIGDTRSQSGGHSDVGGIAGINGGLIQDSEFTGTVRGVSGVGGIVGTNAGFFSGFWTGTANVANYVRNRSAGIVSASEGAIEMGSLIGQVPFFLLGIIPPRLDSNVIVPREGNPTWAIGRWDKQVQAPITSNVPEFYDR